MNVLQWLEQQPQKSPTIWDVIPAYKKRIFYRMNLYIELHEDTDLDGKPVLVFLVDLNKVSLENFAQWWVFQRREKFYLQDEMHERWRKQLDPEELREWDKAWTKAVEERWDELEHIKFLLGLDGKRSKKHKDRNFWK